MDQLKHSRLDHSHFLVHPPRSFHSDASTVLAPSRAPIQTELFLEHLMELLALPHIAKKLFLLYDCDMRRRDVLSKLSDGLCAASASSKPTLSRLALQVELRLGGMGHGICGQIRTDGNGQRLCKWIFSGGMGSWFCRSMCVSMRSSWDGRVPEKVDDKE